MYQYIYIISYINALNTLGTFPFVRPRLVCEGENYLPTGAQVLVTLSLLWVTITNVLICTVPFLPHNLYSNEENITFTYVSYFDSVS